MCPVTASIEVDRSPETTYAYATDPTRFSEWQQGVSAGTGEPSGEFAIGALCHTTRKIGFARRSITSRVTELDPPRVWAVEGIDGHIRAAVTVTVEPLANGRSRLTITVTFTGSGIGKLLVPFAIVPSARREMRRNLAQLKQNLEAPDAA
jgi:uncharacterized protein YndB with AHSA1/START domain